MVKLAGLPSILKLAIRVCCLFVFSISAAQDKNSFDRVVTITFSWFVDFADMNGDQIVDMVGVYGNSSTDIKIFHGKIDGTFELKTTLSGGSSGEFYGVFVKQLNDDNIPDIVAVSNISGIVFLSSPSGYVPATMPATGFFNEIATLFGDFNNDGALDMFIKSQLLINNKNGTFTPKSSLMGNGGAVATNFNNDNFLDIVITNPGSGTVLFYKGKGDGTFETPLTKVATVYEVIAYDLNTDGFVDVIAKGYNREIITFYNDATFSFSQTSTLQLSSNYYSVMHVFDIDHNNVPDLVTSSDSNIQYRSILSNGSFGSEKTFNVGLGSLRRLIVKDAMAESFPDMIVMSGFGITKIYSDKLNATLQFTKTEKIYDGLPLAGFYTASPAIASATVAYATSSAPIDAGTYAVTITANDPNYEGELKGTVSIAKKTLTVNVVDISIKKSDPIPPFTLLYTGFVGIENSTVLTQLPVVNTTATASSEPGKYEITISGGVDENYAFEYKPGTLTIAVVTGVLLKDRTIAIYPNPVKDKISIISPPWIALKIFDQLGRDCNTWNFSNQEISLGEFPSGVYILQLLLENGETFQQRILIH